MYNAICQVHALGRMDYKQAWDLQIQFATEVASGKRPPTLLLLEHPHTYTFGRRGNPAHLLWDETELTRRGIAIHWVDRGGDVTYHGPGQLVGYPLLPLGSPGRQKVDYVGYLRKLEQLIITTVAEFSIEAKQVEGLTGIWVNASQRLATKDLQTSSPIAKLAAIGVKVDARGVSQHGFAINIDPDMKFWEGIIGCGLTHPEISLAQLLNPVPDMETIMDAIIKSFSVIFEYKIDRM